MSFSWRKYVGSLAVAAALALIAGCGAQKKLDRLYTDEDVENPTLVGRENSANLPKFNATKVVRDTTKLRDFEAGHEFSLMKTTVDEETGESVASEVLDASVITARFRNIAERGGKVDLYFDITVPASVQDSRWQVQLFPEVFAMGDSTRLDPLVITGKQYRRQQLRGYERYEKMISSLITEEYSYDRRNFEIFLSRNLPEIYALKGDTSIVSEDSFRTLYGLSEQDILDHYSNRKRNERRQREKDRLTRMYGEMLGAKEGRGVYRDTVLVNSDSSFTYQYVHTVQTGKDMRKVDLTLYCDVLEKGDVVYRSPRTEPYTFYISSTSTLARPEEKYMTRVIERRAAANMDMTIEFGMGRSWIEESLGDNARQLSQAKRIFSNLLQDLEFDVDSIIVSASCSPEGSVAINNRISKERGHNISVYFNEYVRAQQDSLEDAAGITIDEYGRVIPYVRRMVRFRSRSVGEDWNRLDQLVARDEKLSEAQKIAYNALGDYRNLDVREARMQNLDFYPYLRDSLYPLLRRVEFGFYLHRKGMVKDTLVTTVIDTTYKRGLEALSNMEYQAAATILGPYRDYNAAVAAVGADRNVSALNILQDLPPSAEVHYLLAIVYSRMGDDPAAVSQYTTACELDPTLVFRGNLDPEISRLIKAYGLNRDDGDEFDL